MIQYSAEQLSGHIGTILNAEERMLETWDYWREMDDDETADSVLGEVHALREVRDHLIAGESHIKNGTTPHIWYMIWATDRWNGEVHVELFTSEEAAQQGALDFWNFQVNEPIEDENGEVCAVDIETFDELLQRIDIEGMDTLTIDSRPVQGG